MGQWVLSLPKRLKRLRYHLHQDPEALNSALHIFFNAIERHLRKRSRGARPKARTDAVTFTHRFGSALSAHTHFHVIGIAGVLEPDQDHGVHSPEAEDLDVVDAEAVQTEVRRCILPISGVGGRTRRIASRWGNGTTDVAFL